MLCKRFLAGATLLAIMFCVSPEVGASGANSKRPGDVVLLDCGATWCGPCRSMAPIVNEVAGLGWTIRHVDVDQEKELVRRFSITGIPCYIVLVEGQEVGRITGATTRVELETLLTRSSQTPSSIASLPAVVSPASLPNSRAIPGIPFPATTTTETLAIESVDQSTRRTVEPMLPNAIAPSSRTIPMPVAHQAAPVSKSISDKVDRERVNAAPGHSNKTASNPESESELQAKAQLEQKLLRATARLRVEDGQGVSWGTGTVVDCRQGEALVLTCGHIFRDSQGKGRIEIDLFGPGSPRGLAGQVVSWDLKRDLALVSVFTDHQIVPMRIGAAGRETTPGEQVVTVGCNGGSDPTAHFSRITAVDKYLGPANIQVAGQPVQGRSGGGLFALDGSVIGVCNAADPTDNEGLFAALSTIHEQLEDAGLAFIYRNSYPSGSSEVATSIVPSMSEEMPSVSFDRRDRAGAVPTASTGAIEVLSSGEKALLDHVKSHQGKAEVICIVRPHGAAQGASEVFVLQGASSEFLDHLEQVQRTHTLETGNNAHNRNKNVVSAPHPSSPQEVAPNVAIAPPVGTVVR